QVRDGLTGSRAYENEVYLNLDRAVEGKSVLAADPQQGQGGIRFPRTASMCNAEREQLAASLGARTREVGEDRARQEKNSREWRHAPVNSDLSATLTQEVSKAREGSGLPALQFECRLNECRSLPVDCSAPDAYRKMGHSFVGLAEKSDWIRLNHADLMS